MNITELELIEQKLNNAEITSDEAAKLVFNNKKKPWSTKEWKELRSNLIKDHCEQCKSIQEPFILQHLWHPEDYSVHIENYVSKLYEEEITKNPINNITQYELEQFVIENGKPREACPQCTSVNIRTIKIGATTFICNYCNNEFNESIIKNYIPYCLTESDIKNRMILRKFNDVKHKLWEERAEEIRKYAVLKSIEEHRRYIACIDTVTFCKKCSFMWDKNRMKICKVCGKHYHGFIYETCLNCKSKREINIVK